MKFTKVQGILIWLMLSTGCVSTSTFKQTQKDLEVTKSAVTSLKQKLALTTHKANFQACKLDGLVCLLGALEQQGLQKTCTALIQQCVVNADQEYKKETGLDIVRTN